MKSSPILVLLSLLVAAPSASPQKLEIKVVPNQPPLAANAFNPLLLTAIQPQGWLLRPLQIQSSGLSGNLDEFWKDVGPDSGWLGGAGVISLGTPIMIRGCTSIFRLCAF